MRRADGGGADGGATTAAAASDDDCTPGARVCRCFVVGGLPHAAGHIGPSREGVTPQKSEPDGEFERNFGWHRSLLDQGHRGTNTISQS